MLEADREPGVVDQVEDRQVEQVAEIEPGIPTELAEKKSFYLEQLPEEVVDAAWDAFRDALEPLRSSTRAPISRAAITALSNIPQK